MYHERGKQAVHVRPDLSEVLGCVRLNYQFLFLPCIFLHKFVKCIGFVVSKNPPPGGANYTAIKLPRIEWTKLKHLQIRVTS